MIEEPMEKLKSRLLAYEASRWIGTKETGGDNKGQIVEMFQKAVDGKAQGEAWCLAFAQFCIQQVDRLYDEMTLSSNAPSNLIKTEHCLTLWNASKAFRTTPEVGCLVLWQHFKDGKATASGHVGVVKEVHDTKIVTIEGNTGDGAGIVREGDGVFLRERPLTNLGNMHILGYLKVW